MMMTNFGSLLEDMPPAQEEGKAAARKMARKMADPEGRAHSEPAAPGARISVTGQLPRGEAPDLCGGSAKRWYFAAMRQTG